ncbi:MAG: citramalate synthase [Candidatus Omnitrophica bacterium]|nr:citramalate synthase [Candidatus Omnitrophota bacterium]
MSKLELYDTTLRDGAQTEGVSYSVGDKLNIAQKLDMLGIHYIEGGWPGSNPKDLAFFREIKRKHLRQAKVCAFGSTTRPHLRPQRDANIQALLKAETEIITLFGKSWDLHVRYVLKTSLDENLKMIFSSIAYLKSKGRRVIYDAEHFFDGAKDNFAYALKTLFTADQAGADVLVLCDTNGGMITSSLVEIIKKLGPRLKPPLGIHVHNDSGMAIANTIAAVEQGCTHIQGTINGYGERCGNADLIVCIANLKLKLGRDCISDVKLKKLKEVSHFVSELSNMRHQNNQPFVGESAFAHKGGVHINAMVKHPLTYEHTLPGAVGNKRRFLISELSGRTAILLKAKELELGLKKDTVHTKKIYKLLQDLEHQGYQFEAAEGSFELLMKKAMKKYQKFFDLEGFRVIIEKSKTGKLSSEAAIKLKVNKIEEHTASEGDGPVNALDNALRKALLEFYPSLAKMRLRDFKVRVLDERAGTAAKVRVLIQSQDEKTSWGTVGVSENIIEASWQALVDSIEYKLLKDKSR